MGPRTTSLDVASGRSLQSPPCPRAEARGALGVEPRGTVSGRERTSTTRSCWQSADSAAERLGAPQLHCLPSRASRTPPLFLLSAVGIEADSASIAKLLGELEGKDVAEVIAEGRDKLQSVASVAVAAAPAGGAGGAAAPAAAAAPEPESEEEEMGLDLFG